MLMYIHISLYIDQLNLDRNVKKFTNGNNSTADF